MARPEYSETIARTALNRVQNMPFRWSLSAYRGCQHACVYCYARDSHRHLGLNATTDFEQKIIVKINIADLLREELRRPTWRREPVALGTISDPYQPAEARYRLTRRCLIILGEQWTPASIVTKAPLVRRDIDVLRELTAGPGVTVYFSITTVDPELGRQVEPDVAPARHRLAAMAQLAAAGIRTGVMLAPILPGITDKPALLTAVVAAAADHGAQFVHAGILHLRPGAREAYLPFLAARFPHLLPAYDRGYVTAYAPADYTRRTEALVADLRTRHGIDQQPAERQSAQLTLAL